MRRKHVTLAAATVAALAIPTIIASTGVSGALWSQQATLSMPSVTIKHAGPAEPTDPPTPPVEPPRTGTATCTVGSVPSYNIMITWNVLRTMQPLSTAYHVVLRTSSDQYLLEDHGLSGDSPQYSLSIDNALHSGWVVDKTPQDVHVVVRDADGKDIDSVIVTVDRAPYGAITFYGCAV
ncbi:hypothetical protein [Xylanimonas protaetiae]|uniref:Uncharacterized protein n=1 Tax=Xylanimonas protaetiae TaxID=2509457 RepID=A0A4P6F804_9MICO|nr:hypothetical protein [Xylanimonas protaetiae]QAY69387.1 hypothetical protein ET471_04460 [Xylanimonas protaetiae]